MTSLVLEKLESADPEVNPPRASGLQAKAMDEQAFRQALMCL